MSLGPGPFGPATAPGPSAPTHRPRWLLVLSSVALMYGGMLLIGGLGDLRNPTAGAKLPIARPMAPEEEALTRELIAVTIGTARKAVCMKPATASGRGGGSEDATGAPPVVPAAAAPASAVASAGRSEAIIRARIGALVAA